MVNKKLKYQALLSKFQNCPPENYKETEKKCYRWLHKIDNKNNFKPINLINEPPQRLLDENDKMCIGYGLSMFDSLKNANQKYISLCKKFREHQRKDFIENKGKYIGEIELVLSDGIANEPDEKNYGHFTFHEYENVSLNAKINDFFNIFANDGAFDIK